MSNNSPSGTPDELPEDLKHQLKAQAPFMYRFVPDAYGDEVLKDTPVIEALVNINDDVQTLDGDREAEITRLFAANGVEVSFVD